MVEIGAGALVLLYTRRTREESGQKKGERALHSQKQKKIWRSQRPGRFKAAFIDEVSSKCTSPSGLITGQAAECKVESRPCDCFPGMSA